MSDRALLEKLVPLLHGGSYLARVVAVNDPEGIGRVQLRLLAFDGVDDQEAPLWARVAVPFAGNARGAFMIPEVGDEVLVSFVNGDPRQPIVIGSLWNGRDAVPEQLGGSGQRVDRWTITGKAGTRIAIVEEQPADATIRFTTPGGVSGELTDSGGGKIEFRIGGTTVTYDQQGVTVNTALNVTVQATQVEISAAMVTVNAGMSRFNGVVQADTVITNSVISASYTPGAGNIW
ncbi:phage baseplate assembly protein V [Desulfurivibrio sp. D14AmB]|uniref:phage baseplate assembly protein V n=1 Tax=Desulfurivibrio sp. D14AmB TaxID=3374370 RepID=UPI00376EB794